MHRFLFLKRNTMVFLLLFIAHCADNRRLPRRHAWTLELRSLTSSEHEQHQLLAVSQRKLMQQNQERLKPNHILPALYVLTISRCETVKENITHQAEERWKIMSNSSLPLRFWILTAAPHPLMFLFLPHSPLQDAQWLVHGPFLVFCWLTLLDPPHRWPLNSMMSRRRHTVADWNLCYALWPETFTAYCTVTVVHFKRQRAMLTAFF